MKTKIIPFDLETAKKIQKGEIRGEIKTAKRYNARIICWDRLDTETPIIVLVRFGDWEGVFECSTKGEYMEGSGDDAISTNIVLEVPDNEPQFKPYDKVLMRNIDTNWYPTIFSTKELTGFRNIGGELCAYCISYKGNEDFAGTTDKPQEH